ncbi:unnamed protein product [Auanema sp. JU1783]|nr:unnamed protein product [Auanema sp. JU1783]
MKTGILLSIFLILPFLLNAETVVEEKNVTTVFHAPAYTYTLPLDTRHTLNKIHGILMVLSWIFFIPSAFLFARMLRDSFADKKPFGLAIWFHVHRTFNYIGLFLMVASILVIFISKDWRWMGPGSHASSAKQVHTITGVISTALAVAQPILSLFRCPANHSQRSLFNWSHRLIGIISFILATVALVIAALDFKMWKNRALQGILMIAPTALLIVLSVASVMFRKSSNASKQESRYSLRVSLASWGMGILLANTIVLCILIGQGYAKP